MEISMNFNFAEVLEIERVAAETDVPVRELSDLELVLVGGGCGEIIIA